VRQHPLIIGAGPAGTAAAITLAQAGYRPAILERNTSPADKVCGDFLSADSIQCARSLGVDPAALGAAPIRMVRLVHRRRLAESVLPFAALGLSRRALDQALQRRAEEAGARLQAPVTVRRLVRDGPAWRIETAARDVLHTESVFLATGKHDLRDVPRRHTARDAVGMKMYYALAPGPARALEGAVELTLFPGGYAGMQHVEDGLAVLCLAVRQPALHAAGASWRNLVDMIGQTSPRFAAMLAGARMQLPRPLAVAGIPYGYRAHPQAADGLYRLGDQAAVIPSLTGDGMAIALHSGHAAAEAWVAGESSAAYQNALTHGLAPQMRLAGLLHHACTGGSVQAAASRMAGLFPSLLRHAAGRTRLLSPRSAATA
jgi:menaquinone-9 beta-reductase